MMFTQANFLGGMFDLQPIIYCFYGWVTEKQLFFDVETLIYSNANPFCTIAYLVQITIQFCANSD